ncbi:MAG: ribonuclease P protein component [Patescibacteria group bacterium]
MLPKNNRNDRKTVEKVFKEGFFVNFTNISLKYIATKESFPPKISFISPKTASKKAVDRNQLRRRGYAVIKKYYASLPKGFIGCFVFGKKSLQVFGGKKTLKYNPILNLENEIKNILSKIH